MNGREAAETEVPIAPAAPAHTRRAGTRPFPWASHKAHDAMNKARHVCARRRGPRRAE
jgi:hypothetical protein